MIDLEVPISGNVNDPEFNFNPAIRKAITNILTNIVSAPFRLLGNLIGGGAAENISEGELAPLESARRDTVMKFLNVNGGVSAGRLIKVEPIVSDADDGWLELPIGLIVQ